VGGVLAAILVGLVERSEDDPLYDLHQPMNSSIAGHITLGIYAVLLAVGGVIGFVRARSRPSLIAGVGSAVGALVAMGLAIMKNPVGFPLGFTLALVLFVFFGYRYALRAHKFMPSGLMAVISLIVVGVMAMVMDWTMPP
jgi:uncharacterized membrane protein (UPF0136 family)